MITRLNLHYPRAGGLSNAQIAALSQDWAEDLDGFPMPVIRQAAKLCRNDGERHYFPSVGEFKGYCYIAKEELERWQQRQALPAPEQTFESICENSLKRLDEIRSKLKARMTA